MVSSLMFPSHFQLSEEASLLYHIAARKTTRKTLVYTILQLRQVIFCLFIDLIRAIHKKHTKRPHCEQRSLKPPAISLLQRSQCHGTIFITNCTANNYITLNHSYGFILNLTESDRLILCGLHLKIVDRTIVFKEVCPSNALELQDRTAD